MSDFNDRKLQIDADRRGLHDEGADLHDENADLHDDCASRQIPAVTRFAPSPTGYIHIGNVRSAIYPWLLARQTGGKFILRIEDTDQARFVEGATERILETLKWLGLDWDEGPEVGGPAAPYFQSERKEIYHKWARKLIAAGRAYADPTPSEEIQKYREADNAAKVPYLYRNHRPEEAPEWQEGMPLRFRSDPQERRWYDEVMGDLHAGPEVQDDIILIKADGLPTYNFAHIVDDAEMGVTHVIRGVEYLSSIPNYLAIYEALELAPPRFVSLPHILAPTGNKKLSKRDGAKSVTDYRDEGILPEAMLNYLACLGWNDGTEQEIYTREELLEKFSLERIQNSGARFDEVKLLWMNGQWLRGLATEGASFGRESEKSARGSETQAAGARPTGAHPTETAEARPTEEGLRNLMGRCEGFWPESAEGASFEEKMAALAIIYDRLKTLSDLREMTGYFFAEPEVDLEMLFADKNLKKLMKKLGEDDAGGNSDAAEETNAAEKPDMANRDSGTVDGIDVAKKIRLAELLELAYAELEKVGDWNEETLQAVLNGILARSGLKPGQMFTLIRLSISYAPFSPALNLTMEVLGRERTLARLKRTAEALRES